MSPADLIDLPLWRCSDPGTSIQAGLAVQARLSDLQAEVLAAFVEHGPMTAAQAESLPRFLDLAPSTVRKRISELARRGRLEPTGVVRARCAEYRAKETP